MAIALQSAQTVLDTVKIYDIKIQTYIAQNHLLEAINTALQVLQQLGIRFCEQPSQLDIQLEIDAIASLFNEMPIEGLSYLPEMVEPHKLEAMKILSRITTVTQIAAPNLMPLFASRQVSLSIQNGNASTSPVAYANFCQSRVRILKMHSLQTQPVVAQFLILHNYEPINKYSGFDC